MTDWAANYAPLIGSTVEVLKWRPLTCDTPSVIQDFRAASFWFTGAAQVIFSSDRELFLTWTQSGPNMVLEATDESRWGPHALDSLIAYADEPWSAILGSTLTGASFFTLPEIEGEHVVVVRHDLLVDDKQHRLWIGVGWENGISDTDDLWVSVGVDPPNVDDLIKIGSVGS
ncbi:hypothetical protein [uncultured Caulobacter sp.]|uniref:hypothetical protein n=1 Tax=uncultured Caulobacter sp. TaxID=158749 RepID=UPI0026337E07|nr:hypothetical protein [uncultured Caulobacter sp.]